MNELKSSSSNPEEYGRDVHYGQDEIIDMDHQEILSVRLTAIDPATKEREDVTPREIFKQITDYLAENREEISEGGLWHLARLGALPSLGPELIFIRGFFAGRIVQKDGFEISIDRTHISQEDLVKKVDEAVDYYCDYVRKATKSWTRKILTGEGEPVE